MATVTPESVQANIDALNKRIRTEGITDNAGKVLVAPIAADTLATPQTPATLPTPPVDNTNYGAMLGAPTSVYNSPDPNVIPDYLKSYLDEAPKPPDMSKTYADLESNLGIQQKEQNLAANQSAVKAAQGELGVINAELQGITGTLAADKLRLREEGIGMRGIGARNIALEREAAIRAIPLKTQALLAQAKIASAQGDVETSQSILTTATNRLNNLFKIHSDDATNQYNYRKDLRDKVYEYATKAEQRLLDKQKVEEERAYNAMVNNLNQAQIWASSAINNGQGALATQIMSLNPKAPDYQTRLASLAGQLEAKLPATASIQEYEYAKKNGYKGTYEQYQNDDANRKIAIQNGSGLSGPQLTAFNSLADKQNKSPLIAAADRTIVLKNSIEQARKDPGNASQQLSLIYSYIQALDTYQSAVREGELGLVNSIDSKIGQFQSSVEKIQNGQIVRPEVILQIAKAAENIVSTIQQGADLKKKQFKSQAEVQGLGDVWSRYMGGATANSFENSPAPTGDDIWNW